MKKLFNSVLFLLFFTLYVEAQEHDYFITTWTTTSSNETITIPMIGSGYDVDWGDGVTEDGLNGALTHTFTSAGNHTVKIYHPTPQIRFNNNGDKDKIISIDQWGTGAWTSMHNAFYGCSNLNGSATDTPDLSSVTDMINMFYFATSFNQPINDWNVSNV
ncbi:MAG TPA: BspA family leucine-rich repeat surface protein, partial [Sulfurimonas sp.]|nr:BspA family leucine-rich repeat surface protein [Sulfurimonas sp.]